MGERIYSEAIEQLPEVIRDAAARVAQAGGELYVVGGWVRDLLRGVACNDLDLATSLTVEQARAAFEGLGSIYDLGEKFGTIGVRSGEYTIEVTTLRSDEYEPGSRHPRVSPVAGIEEDLARRDLTVNAIAVSLEPDPGRLIDPYDGEADIERRVIRTPGPPGPTMSEDPLRMMRAVRFMAQLDFEIEPALLEVLSSEPGRLDEISWERRRDEFERTLVSDRADDGIHTLVSTGLMHHVIPEVEAMRGVEQPGGFHRANVLEHSILAVSYVAPDPLLRRAALFHDLGKPAARVSSPKVAFPGHEVVGEELTRTAMRRLRYGTTEVQKTAFLVRRHMRPILYSPEWSDGAVRRLVRDCTLLKNGEVLVPLENVIELARADILAGGLQKLDERIALLEELADRIEEVTGQSPAASPRSPLDGNELMRELGLAEGPLVGEVKDHLAEMVLEGTLLPDDRAGAAAEARCYLESRRE